MVNINLTVGTSQDCSTCSISGGNDVSSSAITLTRNVIGKHILPPVYPPNTLPAAEEEAMKKKIADTAAKTKVVPIWNPGDETIVNANNTHYGIMTKLYLKPTLPFTVNYSDLQNTSSTIDLMSIYQPFPLRVNGQQHDACFQIGEFSMRIGALVPDPVLLAQIAQDDADYAAGGLAQVIATYRRAQRAFVEQQRYASTPAIGTTVVVLIPLKVSTKKTKGAAFINAFAPNIANIVASQPDANNGYPDLNVTGMSDWSVADVLQSDRPFYTWLNRDGTRVVVMAEPIGISAENMTHIKRLPVTPPQAAIKEISDRVYYKSAPPLAADETKTKFSISQPPVSLPGTTANSGMITTVALSMTYFIVTVFAIWVAIRLATGYGKTAMEWIGNKLGDGVTSVTTPAPVPQPI